VGFGIAAVLLLGLGLAPGRLVRLLDQAGAAAMERGIDLIRSSHHRDRDTLDSPRDGKDTNVIVGLVK
jgi:hypothetical protein